MIRLDSSERRQPSWPNCADGEKMKFIPHGWNRGKGKAIKWLRDHVAYPHKDWCLIWPFSRTRGYGGFCYMGKHQVAHRFMCELVHGLPPSPEHHAAHSCGNGEDGCVNPWHLFWKTPSANSLDKRLHGTAYREGRNNKLTPQQVLEIRGLRGKKTQDDLAEMFGVGRQNIGAILTGRSWTKLLPPS